MNKIYTIFSKKQYFAIIDNWGEDDPRDVMCKNEFLSCTMNFDGSDVDKNFIRYEFESEEQKINLS